MRLPIDHARGVRMVCTWQRSLQCSCCKIQPGCNEIIPLSVSVTRLKTPQLRHFQLSFHTSSLSAVLQKVHILSSGAVHAVGRAHSLRFNSFRPFPATRYFCCRCRLTMSSKSSSRARQLLPQLPAHIICHACCQEQQEAPSSPHSLPQRHISRRTKV